MPSIAYSQNGFRYSVVVSNSTGSGTRAMIVRLGNGISYFYVFHFAPILDDASYQETLDTIQTAINTTKGWPTNDFFATTLSYDAWRSQHFTATGRADPAISGEGENPDGDGLVNLLGNDPRPPSHRPPIPAIPPAPSYPTAALSFPALGRNPPKSRHLSSV